MPSGAFRFDPFTLDPADRLLKRGDAPVELNARYFDALALLVSEQGKLVSKDRFLEEVWRGVPVTDEALTQCVKTLRRILGDEAAAPRFIETVPKHGYRFVAPVERIDGSASSAPPIAARSTWPNTLLLGAAGTAGAGFAGLVGGLFYGFTGASQPSPGMGAASILLVLMVVTFGVALVGGAGVSFGIALAGPPGPKSVLAGAGGGLIVGALVKLIGLDAFNILIGRSPGDITGAGEGALLGAAVGLGTWVAASLSDKRGVAVAALIGGAAGLLIPLFGGRMMGGSLELLARQVPNSQLRLEPIGALLGEPGFGPIAQALTGALEGALFSGCIVAAMTLARRRSAPQ